MSCIIYFAHSKWSPINCFWFLKFCFTVYKYVILSFNSLLGRYAVSMFADICWKQNKTKHWKYSPVPESTPLRGGERGRFFKIDQIIIGFRWEYLVWLLWQFMNGTKKGLVLERGRICCGWEMTQHHNYNWLAAPCLPSDDLGLRIDSPHLPLLAGPHKLKPSSSQGSSRAPSGHHFSKQQNLFTVRNRDQSDQFVMRTQSSELRWWIHGQIFSPPPPPPPPPPGLGEQTKPVLTTLRGIKRIVFWEKWRAVLKIYPQQIIKSKSRKLQIILI